MQRREDYYEVLKRRDPAFADMFFVGVKSTGIFCRPGCPARTPKIENCEFFDTAAAALSAGYRACQRCHPTYPSGAPSPIVKELTQWIEADPHRKFSESDLRKAGIDPSTARRQFQTCFGMSFVQYVRARRLAQGVKSLSDGTRVIDAQHAAAYESASGFHAAYSKTFGVSPQNDKRQPLYIDWIETKMGRMIAICDVSHLYLLEFTNRKNMTRQFQSLQKRQGRAILPGRTQITDQIESELQAYFNGELTTFKTPLAVSGTPFQQKTWAALQQIPYGQTCAYAALAKRVGDPKAVRAVAGANARNGLAIIIPCHRVIAKDGNLGGYAGGIERKAKLLALEQSGLKTPKNDI